MSYRHRCIDIENRKVAGSDNPLALLVWFFLVIMTVVFPLNGWTKLFIIALEYIACRFFIRGTERDMRFFVGYAFSARSYTNSAPDPYIPLEEFCKPVIAIADDGTPPKRDSIFE